MISKDGYIKEMELEEYTHENIKYSLELSQSPFGDLCIIYQHHTTSNKYMGKMGYKSMYLENSGDNPDILDKNIDKAKEWFYEIFNI